LRKYYALKEKIVEKWATKGIDLSHTLYAGDKENKKTSSVARS
jgi:hypothetical protein